MHRMKWILPALLASSLAVGAGLARADEKKGAGHAEHPKSEHPGAEHPGMDPAAMEKMMALITPGPAHEILKSRVGDWKTKATMWWEPNAEPQVSEGTAHYELILDGRYLVGTYKSMMMGQPFEGHSIDGYDNAKKEYFGIWLDTMGTGYMLMKGSISVDGKTLTHTGVGFDPMQGKDIESRMVTTMIDAKTMGFTMYMPGSDGAEMKVMEITYTRM